MATTFNATEMVRNSFSISKCSRLWLVALLLFSFLSCSAESSDNKIEISNNVIDGLDGDGDGDGEESQTKKFLRKRSSVAMDIEASSTTTTTTALSEHERKLAAGARIVARYNSNRGYELARECASEIIRDTNNEPSEKVKDDDVEGRNNATNPPIEDRSGLIIFIADYECMLFLQHQKQDVLWVDYDHPTKLLEDGESSSWLDWWMDSFTSREGKSRNGHSYDNTNTESERKLQEQYSQWAMSLIQADRVVKGNRNTKVCIVDTGINLRHPVFDGITISGESGRWQWDQDNNGHGTRVAGVIAGFLKTVLVGSGEIELYITRSSGDDGVGYEIDLYIAIEQCIRAGVDVINVSNGSNGLSMYNDFLYHRVVKDHGILLIAAIGNDGDDKKHFPAAHPAAIAVGSVDQNGDFSSFSNSGNWVELVAPGAGIVGPSSTTTSGYTYTSIAGTSVAAPFVAGAAAILRTHYDPRICPSEALRYALSINAVVPGAPLTGINGNNMKPLNPSLSIAMKYDNTNQFYNADNGDRDVKGKCNNQYGNGIVKTRDALEWLSFYDCFSPVLFALQDVNKVVALTTKAAVLPVEKVFDSVGSNYDDHDYDSWVLRDESAKNGDNNDNRNEDTNADAGERWAPLFSRDDDWNRNDGAANEDTSSFDDDEERWAPLFQSNDDWYRNEATNDDIGFISDNVDDAVDDEIGEEINSNNNNTNTNNNNNNNNKNKNNEGYDISSSNENETVANEAIYTTSTLLQMLPWNDPRVSGCYSG